MAGELIAVPAIPMLKLLIPLGSVILFYVLFAPRTNPQNIAGTAYIGEIGDRAFYIISHYPREYGDGFTPRADVILKNLKGSER